MARGQDNPTNNDLPLLPYRVPQIIMIPYDNSSLILIRSKMKTMAMHMPRTNYHGTHVRKGSKNSKNSKKASIRKRKITKENKIKRKNSKGKHSRKVKYRTK